MADPQAVDDVRHVTCTLCEAMCSLEVRLDGDGAIASMRGHEADPLSRGHICPKAFALQDIHEDPDRLRRPVRRTADGGWREVSWDEAIGVRGVPAGGGAARARRRRGGGLPGQPERPQPRRADPQPDAGAAAAHPEPVLRHLGRPAAAPRRGVGALRPPVPAAGARHRPHRPARARRPQPDGVERLAVDGARLPPAAARARLSRRAAGRDRPAPHRDGQGRRRAPLRAPGLRRRGAAGRRARAAGRTTLASPAAYVDGVDAVREAVDGLHARARRAGQRHVRGCRARPRARPRRRAVGGRARADGGLDPGPRRGLPVGGADDQRPHRQPRPARRHDVHDPGGRPRRARGARAGWLRHSAARGCAGCRRSGASCRCRCWPRRSPPRARARCGRC